jgi:transcriptional regulator with XRE-family HTH domain
MSAAIKAKLALKEARIGAGLGREKCAALAGVNRALILRYETGQSVPGIVNAAKIARVIGVELDEIREFEHAVAEAEAARLVVDDLDSDDGTQGGTNDAS